MVGGRGIGAIVALHTALLAGDVKRVICLDMLSHYGAMTEKFPFSWRQSIIIPGVLRHYDLPELAAAMAGVKVTVIDPLDARKQPVAQKDADELYACSGAVVRCGVDGGRAVIEAVMEAW